MRRSMQSVLSGSMAVATSPKLVRYGSCFQQEVLVTRCASSYDASPLLGADAFFEHVSVARRNEGLNARFHLIDDKD